LASALGTAFTYQGQLKQGGNPVTATCDFQFSLRDDPSDGTQIGSTQIKEGVSVSNGLFTVQLDFGDGAFQGDARWLQIAVRCPTGSGSYIPLDPRQALTPAAYALALPGLWTQQNATSPNLIGGYSGNSVTTGVAGATIGGGGASGNTNRVTDDYGAVGGGRNNLAGDNSGTTSDRFGATVGGGVYNTASGSDATVGGGWGNSASGTSATVGGGESNTASGIYATVGGGYNNNTASADSATVGGGDNNTASGDIATIGGGVGNTATGYSATVGGGFHNTASGQYAAVPGGYYASATHYGEMAYASGNFANPGDAQTSVYVLRNTTTDAAATELFLDGSSARLTIASGRTLAFEILVVARSSVDSSAGYRIRGVIENYLGTTSMVGSATVEVLGEDVAAWNVTVLVDDGYDALVIKVTGAAATNIRWVATVRTAEVAW
jgi:hypothetical protein